MPNIMTILILLCVLFITEKTHDIPLAIFDLKLEEERITCVATFIREDLEIVLKKEATEINENEVAGITEILQTYLNTHFRLQINDRSIQMLVQKINYTKHHIEVKGIFSGVVQEIRQIKVYNHCMIDHILKHSNIMNFHFNEQEKMFRLHQKRKFMEVNY